MGADFTAELLKLGKRPSSWILGAVLFAAVLLLGYGLVYALAAALPAGEGTPAGASPDAPMGRGALLGGLAPENLVASVLPTSSSFGGTLALILGALAVGSEYGWGTLKTVLIQRAGRVEVLFGKLLAVGTVLVGFVLLAFAAGVVGSYGVAFLEHLDASGPDAGAVLRGAGSAWLVMMTWASLGMFLAVLFRGTSLAIGLGLAYALVLEAVLTGLPVASEWLGTATSMLPGQSANALANSFAGEGPAGPGSLEPSYAALMLCVYVVGFCALAALLMRFRDVGD